MVLWKIWPNPVVARSKSFGDCASVMKYFLKLCHHILLYCTILFELSKSFYVFSILNDFTVQKGHIAQVVLLPTISCELFVCTTEVWVGVHINTVTFNPWTNHFIVWYSTVALAYYTCKPLFDLSASFNYDRVTVNSLVVSKNCTEKATNTCYFNNSMPASCPNSICSK